MILALDACGGACAAAVLRGPEPLAECREPMARGHAERLPGLTVELLAEAGLTLSKITHIAATVGPGSFTGARVAAGFARGLALALDRPALGVSTLTALAQQAWDSGRRSPMAAVIDARRGAVYAQAFLLEEAGFNALAEPFEAPIDAATARLPEGAALIGGGAELLGATGDFPRFASPTAVGRAAWMALQAGTAAPPAPLYLRAPDAKKLSA